MRIAGTVCTLAVIVSAIGTLAFAEPQIIVSEASYLMGDGETPWFAEAMVLKKAKQVALEGAGTYVESSAKVRNLDLTSDEIMTIAGGIMQTEILSRNREIDGTGLRFKIKIKAVVTTDGVEELAHRVKSGQLATEYKKLQNEYGKLVKELEQLKPQVPQTKNEADRSVVVEKIREVQQGIDNVRSSEAAFYKRLLSGNQLLTQVEAAFQEERTRKEVEQKAQEERERALEDVIQTLRENGHTIEIGQPETNVALHQPEVVELGFAVQVKASPQARAALKRLSKVYKGDLPARQSSKIEEVLKNLTLTVTILLMDGREYVWRHSGIHNFRNPRHYDLGILVEDNPTSIYARIEIPRSQVSKVSSVQGKIMAQ